MASEIAYIFGSVILVSLVSFIGIAGILFSKRNIDTVILFLVSFAVGALLGDVFIHLLPQLFEKYSYNVASSLYLLLGILLFFSLEKFIHWRHCHATGECEVHGDVQHPHSLAIMNIVGDGLHNLMDGIIIGASYMLSVPVGITTTIAVILHEVPQEIGDFGVLLHAGLSKTKAILFNFLSALLAIIGAIIAIVASGYMENLSQVLIPITAGGFIYIAGVDLIPELHKSNTTKLSLLQLLGLVLGASVMLLLLLI